MTNEYSAEEWAMVRSFDNDTGEGVATLLAGEGGKPTQTRVSFTLDRGSFVCEKDGRAAMTGSNTRPKPEGAMRCNATTLDAPKPRQPIVLIRDRSGAVLHWTHLKLWKNPDPGLHIIDTGPPEKEGNMSEENDVEVSLGVTGVGRLVVSDGSVLFADPNDPKMEVDMSRFGTILGLGDKDSGPIVHTIAMRHIAWSTARLTLNDAFAAYCDAYSAGTSSAKLVANFFGQMDEPQDTQIYGDPAAETIITVNVYCAGYFDEDSAGGLMHFDDQRAGRMLEHMGYSPATRVPFVILKEFFSNQELDEPVVVVDRDVTRPDGIRITAISAQPAMEPVG